MDDGGSARSQSRGMNPRARIAYQQIYSIMGSIAEQFPENKGIGAELQPLTP